MNAVTGQPYTANGTEVSTPFSATGPTSETKLNGRTAALAAIILTDDAGNGYIYYKLRGLERPWASPWPGVPKRGLFIETE